MVAARLADRLVQRRRATRQLVLEMHLRIESGQECETVLETVQELKITVRPTTKVLALDLVLQGLTRKTLVTEICVES